jgi:hypothetical protein
MSIFDEHPVAIFLKCLPMKLSPGHDASGGAPLLVFVAN